MQDSELKAFAFACIDKLKQSNVSRFSIQNGDFSLTIETQPAGGIPVPQRLVETASEEEQPAEQLALTGTVVPAPLVGTFYTSDAPDRPPLVQPGDTVKAGDVLCIIEAMKIMNNIESPCDGTISRVLAANGDLVEYNQPLFVIE